MYAGADFTPAIEPGETIALTFDITPMLAGATFSGQSWVVTDTGVGAAADPSPNAQLVGSPAVVSASGRTTLVSLFGNGSAVSGCYYEIEATFTSTDGQRQSIYSRLLCQAKR